MAVAARFGVFGVGGLQLAGGHARAQHQHREPFVAGEHADRGRHRQVDRDLDALHRLPQRQAAIVFGEQRRAARLVVALGRLLHLRVARG